MKSYMFKLIFLILVVGCQKAGNEMKDLSINFSHNLMAVDSKSFESWLMASNKNKIVALKDKTNINDHINSQTEFDVSSKQENSFDPIDHLRIKDIAYILLCPHLGFDQEITQSATDSEKDKLIENMLIKLRER